MTASAWPPGVTPIAVGDLKRLGIGPDNQLYWDGQPVEIRRKLALTWPQSILAALAAVATILSGVNNTAVYLCGRDIHVLGCPAPAVAVVAHPAEPAVQAPAGR
jgi:hypothetical protein